MKGSQAHPREVTRAVLLQPNTRVYQSAVPNNVLKCCMEDKPFHLCCSCRRFHLEKLRPSIDSQDYTKHLAHRWDFARAKTPPHTQRKWLFCWLASLDGHWATVVYHRHLFTENHFCISERTHSHEKSLLRCLSDLVDQKADPPES